MASNARILLMHELYSFYSVIHIILRLYLRDRVRRLIFCEDLKMTSHHIDVLAVGNAIVDIFGQCDDSFLAANKIEKGVMTLLDPAASAQLYAALSTVAKPQLISGGSAANTAVGVVNFGGTANFVGRVHDDDLGGAFRHDLIAAGVGFDNPPARSGSPTASSIILVTPDAARSMNTCLGASIEFEATDLELASVDGAKVIYLEGYLFDALNGPVIFKKPLGLRTFMAPRWLCHYLTHGALNDTVQRCVILQPIMCLSCLAMKKKWPAFINARLTTRFLFCQVRLMRWLLHAAQKVHSLAPKNTLMKFQQCREEK